MDDTGAFVEDFNRRKEKTERNNRSQGQRDYSRSLPAKKAISNKNKK
ncbi:hypothetical protein [Alteribacter lacisalsi]|nr:hypothetical protein [Alteribacter lacisalsi]